MTSYRTFSSRYQTDSSTPISTIQDLKDQVQTYLTIPPEHKTLHCTTRPVCQAGAQYKPQYSSLPVTFLSWNELSDGKLNKPITIGERDSKIWVADLSAIQYGRQRLIGSEWAAESTLPHIQNRVLFSQYRNATKFPKSSPNEKQIETIQDSYAMLQHHYGPHSIQYTSF